MAASVSPAASPPRRHRHRHDDSPPRRRRRHDDDSPRHRDDRKRRASPSPSPSPSPSDRDADRHRGKSRASPPRRPRDSDPAESNGGGAPKPGGDNGGDRSPRRARVPDAEEEGGDRRRRPSRVSDDDKEGGRRRRRRSTDSDDERGDRHRRRHRRRSPSSESSDGGRSRRHRRDESSRRQRDERRRDRGGREERRRSPDRKEPTPPLPPPPPLLPELIPGRTGGIYIPPFRMAQMMREVEDKSSPEYQRLSWDALKKSINGLVNKVNATNIKNIVPELFAENLVRGRGLFCQSCIKSQMASPGFTDVFAALVAVVNTKFPEIGRLLLVRVVLQLKRAYKRNDKPQLLAATKFIAHLVNQVVAHELVALELLTVLLENPTDDSVEVAVGFVKECGAMLQDLSPQGLHAIFERFRGILHEGEIDKRVQFLIEGLFAIRKAKFQGFPAIRPELDLVEQEDQFTHEISLEDELDPETNLNVFRANPNFAEDEKAYENLKRSILGAESSDDEEGSDDASDEDAEEESDDEEDEEQMEIRDQTETNLINLRRTIYLTIMSSVDFEEAGHKLLKIKLEPGQESFGSVPMGTEIAAVPNISEGLAKISKKMMDLAAQLQVLAAQSAEQAMPLGAAERSDRRAMTFLRPRQQDFKRRLRSRMRHMQQPKVASTAPPLPKPPPRGLRPSCWACRWRCHLQPRWHGFRQEQGWRRGFWKRQEQQSCFHRYFQQRRWRKRRLLLPWSHGVKQGHHVLLGMALNTIEGDRDSVFPQLRQLNGPDWWTGLRSAASPCWLRYAYHTMELCIMLLECCSQERTYLRYYGLLGQRFCMINKVYQENFEKCFVQQYSMIHRLETNKLRNVAKFFAHLLGTDALPWHVLAYIRLTEEDTTSSSRIFIKILFQELSEHLGIRLLNEKLNDPNMQDSFDSIFPKDHPKNTRFSINFFTSIGLGGITETLREYLKNMPRLIMQQQKPASSESGSSDSGSASDSSSSESESSSDESDKKRSKRRKR
ncbi:hypothetical protein OsJ_35744 [Oryza sativa Japonica Group]|uniref:MI domain-containing protein n=1 Tax=Oryza sativa subsp. japonica TaxID=39947 RepID=B9GCM0_ORYSJ|nr:hypothetical protein OsJ_35744 [Oryza sativa Japonica Group]